MICYVLAMGKNNTQDRTWLWDTALKFFGRAFSLRHQITWNITGDILDSLFYYLCGTIYDVITFLICIMQKREYL